MKPPHLSRRAMIKRSAIGLGIALVPHALNLHGESSPKKSGIKIGVVDWELGKASDPEALAIAARLGFDGLQVDLGDVTSFQKPDLQDRYDQLSRKYRVSVASLALGKLSDAPYGSDSKGQALVDAAIDVAKTMGQKILLLAFFGNNGLEKEGNKLDLLVGRLKENAPKAEKAGVILGLEGEATAAQYAQIIDRVGSPAVKVYFDCVHAHEQGKDIFEEIRSLGDRICEFHAKDYGNILFGQGEVDWRQVRKGIDAINFRGWVHVEQWGEVKGQKPLGFEATHRKNLQYLRTIF